MITKSLSGELAMQAKLMEEWAKIDLHGAFQTYLGETWDERHLSVDGGDSLSNEFKAAFLADPLGSWNVLVGSGMAIAREMLAGAWGDVAGQKDPAMVISVIREMPAFVQITRLRTIFCVELSAKQREELSAKLGTAGDAGQFAGWIKAIGGDPPVNPADSFGKWSDKKSGPEKTRETNAWATSLKRIKPEEFATEWANVPEEDRGQTARLLSSRVDNQSPALLAAIDCAIAAGQWDALKENVTDKLRGYPDIESPEMREWALTVPAREETRAIYNLAISNYFLNDLTASKKWLERLAAGNWHREAGFVEMVLGSMWVKGELAAAQRAAKNITDARRSQEAAKAMCDWQLMTRRPEIAH